MYGISIVSKEGRVLASAQGETRANLYYRAAYNEGDRAVFTSGAKRAKVRVDDCVGEARVYLPKETFTYVFPLSGDNPDVYPPFAFKGEKHLLSIAPDEDGGRRNLALNPADQRGETDAYPHAAANVETRNESVFCARNVIDGMTIANGHGKWPYGSWGIGAREDACLTVDFGRDVEVDEIALFLRADFPHDAYWIRATAEFSGGFEITFPLKGEDGAQRVTFEKQTARWIRLRNLVKCDMPSAFPSLRQLQVYGKDA